MNAQYLYGRFLLLYPKPFRSRFGGEMLRLHQDCYPANGRARFWIETLKDLAISVPSEWRREVCREDNEIDYTGIADAFMCTLVVGTLLLGWGWLGASVALEMGGLGGNGILRDSSAELLFTIMTLATAVLVGILGKFAAARSGVIDTTCSQLISYERTTAHFSR
jgi:hypothetical protein